MPVYVVICLQISIFELLNTTSYNWLRIQLTLWFAYKLVSLNYWIQLQIIDVDAVDSCDLLTN